MDNEERQRTMDFILQQQAQFSSSLLHLNGGLERLGRVVVLLARQFRRERKDLRERIAALIDAQVKSEVSLSRSDERITRMEDVMQRTSKDIAALTYTVECNSDDIRALLLATERNSASIGALTTASEKDRENIRALTAATERDRENIAALADMIDKLARRQSGNGDGS